MSFISFGRLDDQHGAGSKLSKPPITKRTGASTAAPQSEVDDAEEQESSNNATGSSDDEDGSTEDDFDSADDDLVDDRTIVDMVLDISADMEVLRDRKDTLSAEEINAVLAEVELIAQYALELKIRLEDDLEAAA